MSSVVIPRAAEPCLLVLGSPTPGAAPGCGATTPCVRSKVAAGNSPCTAAGAAPVTNAESHPPSLLVSQHYLAPYVITTKLPSSEGRGQEALPRALLTEHARIQLY